MKRVLPSLNYFVKCFAKTGSLWSYSRTISSYRCNNYQFQLNSCKFFGSVGKQSKVCWKCNHKYDEFNYFCPECRVLQTPTSEETYFDLFQLERRYDINRVELTGKFRKVQSYLHPDKYTRSTEKEQVFSSEYSSLVNKAYSVLSDPLDRAIYLLQLNGKTLEEHGVQMDPKFLSEMMELNEEIDSANSSDALEKLEKSNNLKLDDCYIKISRAFEENDLSKAKKLVYVTKYFRSIRKRIKDLKSECFS